MPAPRTRTSSRSKTVLRFVSKGQSGTLMMCLLSVSAAICLKLPHYVNEQIKCTPGPRARSLTYCLCQVTGCQCHQDRPDHLTLHVCHPSHDTLLIILKPLFCQVAWSSREGRKQVRLQAPPSVHTLIRARSSHITELKMSMWLRGAENIMSWPFFSSLTY